MLTDEATVHEAHERVSSGEAALLDVREPVEWRQSRIAGAVLIPMNEVPDRLEEIPADRDVYVYCRSGARSGRVVGWLRQTGSRPRTANVSGGIEAWIEAGLPVE